MVGELRPCYDIDYDSAAVQWMKELKEWEAGTHPELCDYIKYYWEYSSPPDKTTCRPRFEKEPTWFQVYETVSEGTPVTPPFSSKAELVEYLVEYGDDWSGPVSRQSAMAFVETEWAPSMVISNGVVTVGIESLGGSNA